MSHQSQTTSRWMTASLAAGLLSAGLVVGLPGSSEGAPTGGDEPLERADDAAPEPAVGGPTVAVSGVHAVAPDVERYMAKDIARKLRAKKGGFARCYRRHARGSQPDRRITVDFTVTTDGAAVGLSVFTKHQRAKSCIKSVISGISFAPAPDRHPRARVDLYF